MSNAGQAISAGIGATIGFLVGGPTGAQIGFQVGLLAGNALFPTELPGVEGPRLEDFEQAEADPGAVVPKVWGTAVVPGFRMYLGPVSEQSTTTSQGGKGGPEQETTTFSYSQTLAVGLCEGPIAGVQRIWENGELVYDARTQQDGETEADFQARADASVDYASGFTLYFGNETQTADAQMTAELGAGAVPAFRGLAYIVFADRELRNDQGQRHPSFKFEILAEESPAIVAVGNNGTLISTDGGANFVEPPIQPPMDGAFPAPLRTAVFHEALQRFVALGASDSVWTSDDNGATWVEIENSVNGGGSSPIVQSIYIPTTGDIFALTGGGGGGSTGNVSYSTDGGLSFTEIPVGDFGDGTMLAADLGMDMIYIPERDEIFIAFVDASDNSSFWAARCAADSARVGANWENELISGTGINFSTGDGRRRGVAYWPSGEQYFVGGYTFGSSQIPHVAFASASAFTTWGTTSLETTGNSDPVGLVVTPDGSTMLALTVRGVDNRDIYSGAISPAISFGARVPQPLPEEILWNGLEYLGAYDRIYAVGRDTIYYSVDDGLTYVQANMESLVDVFDIASGGSVEDIQVSLPVREICESAGLTNVDVSELTDSIVGYAVLRPTTARGMLTPLRTAGQFDYVESGETLVFRRRGGAVVDTALESDLGARIYTDRGEDPPPSMTITKIQDVELPRQVGLRYISQSRDYEYGEKRSLPRLTGRGVNESTINLAVTLTEQRAAELAEIIFRDIWASRNGHQFSVDVSKAAWQEGDAILVPSNGRNYRVRITSITERDLMVRTINAVRDDDGAYVSVVQADAPIRPGNPLSALSLTTLILLDLPPLLDTQNDAAVSAAVYASSGGSNWPGARINRSTDGGETFDQVAAAVTQPAVGTLDTVPTTDSGTWDVEDEIIVDITNNQQLESRTRAAVLAGANACALGQPGRWCIFQFTDAALVAENQYRLTGLLSSRRGTEHNLAALVPGDQFVMLSTGGLYDIATQVSAVGSERTYRAVTIGAQFETGTDVTFTPNGERLRPLSPVRLRGSRDGSENLTITWMRRDRLSEALRDGVAVPNSESSEAYEVDIMDGASVVRTLTGLSSPTATYTAADQVTDFGSEQSSVTVRVYQLSAAVGRGTAAEETV